jgi:hypothetical protein
MLAMRLGVTALVSSALFVNSVGEPLRAQECTPPPGSHEARLEAFFAAPLAFSPASAPSHVAAGAVRIGGELVPIPTPDAMLEQTGLCYEQKGEHTRLASVFARPRVSLGIPAGLLLEGSYVPPVTVGEARVHLGSVALSLVRRLGRTASGKTLTAMLRTHATFGEIRGAVTCPRNDLQEVDPALPCFGSRPSRDTFHPTTYGSELTVGISAARGRLDIYGGAGVTWLRPRFRAAFIEGDGEADNTLVVVNLTRGAVFGGVTLRPTRALDLSLQAYAVPADVTTFRLGAGYRLR